jgi:hypothetical protein
MVKAEDPLRSVMERWTLRNEDGSNGQFVNL